MADRVCWQTCSDRTADPRNQFPGEPLLNQEFRLFTILMLPPVLGLYGLPINLVHLPQVTPRSPRILRLVRQRRAAFRPAFSGIGRHGWDSQAPFQQQIISFSTGYVKCKIDLRFYPSITHQLKNIFIFNRLRFFIWIVHAICQLKSGTRRGRMHHFPVGIVIHVLPSITHQLKNIFIFNGL